MPNRGRTAEALDLSTLEAALRKQRRLDDTKNVLRNSSIARPVIKSGLNINDLNLAINSWASDRNLYPKFKTLDPYAILMGGAALSQMTPSASLGRPQEPLNRILAKINQSTDPRPRTTTGQFFVVTHSAPPKKRKPQQRLIVGVNINDALPADTELIVQTLQEQGVEEITTNRPYIPLATTVVREDLLDRWDTSDLGRTIEAIIPPDTAITLGGACIRPEIEAPPNT